MSERLTDEQLHELIAAEDYALADPRELVAEVLEARTAARVRRIETDAELHAVAPGVVVRAKDGTIAARFDYELGVVFGYGEPFAWKALHAPAEILFDPETTQCAHGYNLTDSCPGCDAALAEESGRD